MDGKLGGVFLRCKTLPSRSFFTRQDQLTVVVNGVVFYRASSDIEFGNIPYYSGH